MSVSPHAVLVTTCKLYDAEGEPPSAPAVAERLDATTGAVRRVLRSLCRAEFLAETGAGYRPTVTARELCERGIHLDDVAAVDVVEEG